jgi:DNA-binding transcriptional LysR family regulator
MEEKDCLILQYLYEEQNFTKAAERLYMTQPALTYRLRQLEKEFQVEIFSKSGKNVKMTPAGEYLVSYAKKQLLELRKTKEYLLNMGNEVKGSLKVGVNSHFGLYHLPAILKEYSLQYPNVHLNVDTGFSKEMMELLKNGEIDIAIVRGDYDWTDQSYLLSEETICIVSEHEMNLDDLPSLPFINRKEPSVLIKYKNAQDIPHEQSIDYWWNERYEVPPNTTMLVDSYETCKEMVKMDLGFSIIPRAFISDTDDLYCQDLVFQNGEMMKKRTWLLYRQSSLQLAAISKFVTSIKTLYGIEKD